jgi:DNA-binding FadR family transcriptional regulator
MGNLAATTAESGSTAADLIFDKLLADIIRGVHPAGSRLPPERELARQLGVARRTLRDVLRRLTEWRLVETRRGVGLMIRPYRDWSIEVFPAYLRYGGPPADS